MTPLDVSAHVGLIHWMARRYEHRFVGWTREEAVAQMYVVAAERAGEYDPRRGPVSTFFERQVVPRAIEACMREAGFRRSPGGWRRREFPLVVRDRAAPADGRDGELRLPADLTEAQREVAWMLARGMSQATIAEQCGVTRQAISRRVVLMRAKFEDRRPRTRPAAPASGPVVCARCGRTFEPKRKQSSSARDARKRRRFCSNACRLGRTAAIALALLWLAPALAAAPFVVVPTAGGITAYGARRVQVPRYAASVGGWEGATISVPVREWPAAVVAVPAWGADPAAYLVRCPADADCNGRVDAADVGAFVARHAEGRADFDGDGDTDAADAAAFLAAYQAGCP